jgi:lipopolysaccharide transport system permease protein
MATTTRPAGFELRAERLKLGPLLRDVWAARGLIRTLARKDFYVRYRRASIGLLWAIGLPLIQALVLVVIFTRITNFHLSVSYPVFVITGMVSWSFFSGALVGATTAIVDGAGLASKVYFPRATLPIISILSNFHGYIPSLAILLGLAAIFKASLGLHLILLVPATLLMLGLAIGFALVLAALHVYFRDMKYIVQAIILPWFWASGVVYPLKSLGSLGRWLEFNPAVGMIQIYRAALGTATQGWRGPALITLAWVVVLFCAALPLYRRYDRVFVDLL